MAKKKKGPTGPKYLGAQAEWRRRYIREIRALEDDGDSLGAALAERKLRLEEEYLKDSIRLLRKYVGGFKASEGYDLNKLAYIPAYRLSRVKKYAPIIRQETSAETDEGPAYTVVRPRTARGRHALEQFTGQRSVPNRRAWIVPLTDPQRERVHLVSKTVRTKDSRGRSRRVTESAIEVTRKVGNQILYERYFRFPEPPLTFDDVIRMTRKLLRFMPRGWYVIETSNYGAISVAMRKEDILNQLQERFLVYDKIPQGDQKDNRGLAETVIGYKLVGMHSEDVDREYDERLTRRMAARRFRQQQREARRRRALRPLRGL